MRTRRRTIVWIAVLAGLLLAAVFLRSEGTTSAESRDPRGTLALRRFLHNLGVDAADGDLPAPPGTYVLLADLRDPLEEERIIAWVESGGTLVVADPGSPLFESFEVAPVRPTGGFAGRRLSPACATASVAGVRHIVVGTQDALLRAGPRGVQCFTTPAGAFAVEVRRGGGRATLLGGPSLFTNRYLAQAENARYVLNLVGKQAVRFGSPVATGAQQASADRSVWSLLPSGAKAVVIQLGIAALLFALSRARRLGRPLPEPSLSPIPAGELVNATGRLLRTAKASSFASEAMRDFIQRRMARRTPGARNEELQRALAEPAPRNDAELIAAAAGLERLRKRIEEEEV